MPPHSAAALAARSNSLLELLRAWLGSEDHKIVVDAKACRVHREVKVIFQAARIDIAGPRRAPLRVRAVGASVCDHDLELLANEVLALTYVLAVAAVGPLA